MPRVYPGACVGVGGGAVGCRSAAADECDDFDGVAFCERGVSVGFSDDGFVDLDGADGGVEPEFFEQLVDGGAFVEGACFAVDLERHA